MEYVASSSVRLQKGEELRCAIDPFLISENPTRFEQPANTVAGHIGKADSRSRRSIGGALGKQRDNAIQSLPIFHCLRRRQSWRHPRICLDAKTKPRLRPGVIGIIG